MKKRNYFQNTLLVILFLTLLTVNVFLVYLHFFASRDGNRTEEWSMELDMTDRAAAAALDWLQDIEGVSVSLEDLESRMQGLTIRINLTQEQALDSEGGLRCSVVKDSYESCEQAAYEALAGAFRELMAERLLMSDYPGSVDEAAVEALVEETFGMSTVSYLKSCGPSLLPSTDELQFWYGEHVWK